MGQAEGRDSPLTPSEDIQRLLAPLRAIASVLLAREFPGVIIGGVAASLLGRPRFTRDLDAVVLNADLHLVELVGRLGNAGIYPRIADALDFARESRVLLLRHADSSVDVDLSMGLLPFEEAAVQNRQLVEVEGITLPLPQVEDLIVLKAVAHRPRDLEDIRSLCLANPCLDRGKVLRSVEEFAALLDAPDLLAKVARLLEASA